MRQGAEAFARVPPVPSLARGLTACLARLVPLAAISILLVGGGLYLGVKNHHYVAVGIHGLRATSIADQFYRWTWEPVRYRESGVRRLLPAKASDGLTFYVSGGRQSAYLIDMDGTIVHQWGFRYSQLQGYGPQADTSDPDRNITWDSAHLFPNGDVIAVFRGHGWNPGMVKIDKDSRLIWRSELRHHHVITVGGDGRIYTLTKRVREEPVPGFRYIRPPILEDFLVILDAAGRPLQRISIIEAFRASSFAQYLELPRELDDGDSFHTNKAQVIPPGLDRDAPFLRPGNVIISLREIHTIAVLDPRERKIVWASKGPWFFQHDPEILANGDILLFDNRGDPSPTGHSRVLEIDPRNHAVVWSYTGTAEDPLDSIVRSGVQRLANGNTLIAESDGGRILEVTPSGEVVWDFVNPDRKTFDVERVSIIGLGATRFRRDELDFLAPGQRPDQAADVSAPARLP